MDLEMFYNFVIDFVVIGDSPRPEICKNLGVHAPLSLRNFRSDRIGDKRLYLDHSKSFQIICILCRFARN